MKKKLKAFTLAEVLITLAIVGVVAALTLPNLIVNHQKKEVVTRLKKVYSVLSQAKVRAEVDYGDFDNWEFPTVGSDKEQNLEFFNKYFAPYMQVVDCTQSVSSCPNSLDSTLSYLVNSHGYTWHSTTDGIQILMSPSNMGYVYVIVDLNGGAKPNLDGKDIFHMNIRNNGRGVVLFGQAEQKHTREEIISGVAINNGKNISCCSRVCPDKSFAMYNCSALIQMDGWQIKDDYPW